MPSFCWPFGFGPKPAMTRPRTGQRKLGIARGDVGLGLRAARAPAPAGVTTCALAVAGALGTEATFGADLLLRHRLRRRLRRSGGVAPLRRAHARNDDPVADLHHACAARCCWPWRSRRAACGTCATAPSAFRRARRCEPCWPPVVAGAAIAGAAVCGALDAVRGAALPVTSYLGMTSRWPGFSAGRSACCWPRRSPRPARRSATPDRRWCRPSER